jgi:hypothetical protein
LGPGWIFWVHESALEEWKQDSRRMKNHAGAAAPAPRYVTKLDNQAIPTFKKKFAKPPFGELKGTNLRRNYSQVRARRRIKMTLP